MLEAVIGSSTRVHVAQTFEEVEALRQLWNAVPWLCEEAEYDYFMARARARSGTECPFGIIVSRNSDPVAAIVGRLQTQALHTRLGFWVVYAPSARALSVVEGGVISLDEDALSELLNAVASVLREGKIDVVSLPSLPVNSQLHIAFAGFGGPFDRARFVDTWTRQLIVLPESFADYLSSRSWETRRGVRKNATRLGSIFGDELRMRILREPTDMTELVRDLDYISKLTYQHDAGGGFTDTEEQRQLVGLGLQQGWLRAYVLYLRDKPIAYWFGSVHEDRMVLRTTGYDPEYGKHRVGAYLMARMIEDACSDPSLRIIDFGPGRSTYKRHFATVSQQECYLSVYAPTLRARRINATRTTILGVAHFARWTLDKASLTDRVRAFLGDRTP